MYHILCFHVYNKNHLSTNIFSHSRYIIIFIYTCTFLFILRFVKKKKKIEKKKVVSYLRGIHEYTRRRIIIKERKKVRRSISILNIMSGMLRRLRRLQFTSKYKSKSYYAVQAHYDEMIQQRTTIYEMCLLSAKPGKRRLTLLEIL